MASSSSVSTIDPQQKHQVFLNFRGEDTRNNFLAHLNEALKRKGIGTFIDSEQLQRGEQISSPLLTAIEESTISLIVFSENYASSSWCLEELSKIMELKDTKRQIVVPIFYRVDPSHVRKQTGCFQKGFAEHEKNRMDDVEKWRHALTQAGHLSGYHMKGDEPEPAILEKIVQDVLKNLNRMSSSDREGLIGIDPKIEEIKSLLRLDDREKSRVLGIWGMGGIGKTTLAQAVFGQIFAQFDSYCFLANVRERLLGGGAPSTLQNELLSKLLSDTNLDVSTPLTLTKDRLCKKRVLIVLDDVTDFEQLEALGVSDLHHLGRGSRIIVTTRDRHVLEEGFDAPAIYEVQGLNKADSLHLFSLKAFKQEHPKDDFKVLSNRVLLYAKGVPIALKVLGGALSGKGKQYWESVLIKLKEHPDEKIMKVLKISFDGLDDAQKEIFLDIACTFKGHKRDRVTKILGTVADCVIEDLVYKCLLYSTSAKNNYLEMHDLIQEMGMDVVLSESKNLGKHSRLCTYEGVFHVLKHDKGTEAIRSINLLSYIDGEKIELSPTAFNMMPNLTFLKIDNSSRFIFGPQGLKSLPNKLRYLHWGDYPLISLPSNFCPKNLVEIRLSYSDMEQLWNGEQNLVNLRVLDLEGCKKLIRIPDLLQAINLETLYLRWCISLVELPCLNHLKYLTVLYLSGCCNLKKFPEVPNHLPRLNLSDTKIEEVPDCVENLQVQHLNMFFSEVKNVSSNIYKMGSLTELDLSFCPIAEFPEVPWSSSGLNLWTLRMNGTRIQHLPSSILKSLEVLEVAGCKYLKSLPELPPSLASLDANSCMSLEEVSFADQNQTTIWKSYPRSTFGHCFSLKQNAIKNIVDNELLKVQCLAKQLVNEYYLPESMKFLLRETKERAKMIGDKTYGLRCLFPGSEIPESFEHQSPNSSINVKLEPKRGSSRFLGFSICTVLHAADKEYGSFIVKGKCKLKSIYDDDNHIFQFEWEGDLTYEKHLQNPDLVSIYFGGHHMFCENKLYEASFDFYSRCYAPEYNIVVKKCGVHVVYQDAAEAGEVRDLEELVKRKEKEKAIIQSALISNDG